MELFLCPSMAITSERAHQFPKAVNHVVCSLCVQWAGVLVWWISWHYTHQLLRRRKIYRVEFSRFVESGRFPLRGTRRGTNNQHHTQWYYMASDESLLVEQKDVRVLSSMNRPHGTPPPVRCSAALFVYIYTPRALVVVSREIISGQSRMLHALWTFGSCLWHGADARFIYNWRGKTTARQEKAV